MKNKKLTKNQKNKFCFEKPVKLIKFIENDKKKN